MNNIRGTTIVAVRKGNCVAVAGDGQVTMGDSVIMKGNARKVRKIYNDEVIVGFAGATADAFTLEERFEGRLKEFSGDIKRAAVEMAKEWRTDRVLRRLEAMLLVANEEITLLLSGSGDVIEPEEGAVAIGSGGNYAFAAAKAYLDSSTLSPKIIAERAILIASGICIFTNSNIIVEELGNEKND